MTQPDHSARHRQSPGPKRRGDTTHPASTRSRTRRGGDRLPYPTAATTTRVSPAKPGSPRARSRSRGSTETPTPATVWTASPTRIDLDTDWPTPIVEKIVRAFSEPGGRVALLPWPTTQPVRGDRPQLVPIFSDRELDRALGAEPDGDVAEALAAVESLHRTTCVVRVPVDATVTGPGSRPFWADLVSTPDSSPATVSSPSRSDFSGGVLDDDESTPADLDLIITCLPPEHGGDHSSDLVTLVAARLLRVGGTLAVLTHCDWTQGELIDPTGAVVAAAQNADLLYFQHVVALHAPVHDGRLAVDTIADSDGATAENEARALHRATIRGLPEPHRRIHSDIVVFSQPHQFEPLAVSPAEQGL